jgi:thiol-disulfide isomerase/thioredoxin
MLMWIIKRGNILLLLLTLVTVSIGANILNCRIDFIIRGLENKKIFFAYEYGNRQIVVDTIKLDGEGKGFYSSKNRLTGGMYIVVFPNNKYVELLVNDEQFFTVNSDTTDLFKNFSVEGSEESELFRQYQLLVNEYDNIVKKDKVASKIHDTTTNKALLYNKPLQIKQKLDSFKEKTIFERQKSFLSLYFMMQQDPVVPENLVNGKPDLSRAYFLKRYNYSKLHYFDNMPFSDIRILRTRLIYDKLDYYFNRFIPQESDSLISAINHVISLAQVQEESYHFVLNFINYNFRNPKNPSQEKAFVYLADNFYLNGKVPWPDSRYLKLLSTKIDAIKPSLIGNIAPNLELNNLTGKIFKLHDIQSEFLIIYFWSPDCGECKAETPKLFEIYDKFKSKGLEVIAIYAHADKGIWENYLKEKKYNWINAFDPLLKSDFTRLYNVRSIPKILLLDKDKRIIAKDINTSQLEMIIKTKMK